MRKSLLVACLVSLCLIKSKAQDFDDKYTQWTNILPPSPAAASLGVYGNYSISGFTGAANISVPIYTIEMPGYKLPVSLQYNPTGIKVNDVASWVGLGWSLNAGGVITRNVMGIPDDFSGTAGEVQGYLSYNFLVPPQSYPAPIATGYNPLSHIFQNVLGAYQLRHAKMDCEPDVFTYNFNGHTGRFVFSQGTDPSTHTGQPAAAAHKVNLIPYADIDVQYEVGTPTNTWGALALNSFTILDEMGNKYLFTAREVIQPMIFGQTFSKIQPNGIEYPGSQIYDLNNAYTSSWYLTKIITTAGREINFTYTTESYYHRLPISYSVRGEKYGSGIGNNGEPLQGDSHQSATPCVEDRSYSINRQYIAGVRLSTIEWADNKIVFSASDSRSDLVGTNALTSVGLYAKDVNGNFNLKKSWELGHSYLQSPAETVPDISGAQSTVPMDDGADKRLMLNTITERGADGSSNPPYQFTYDNTYTLPNRYSVKQDFWGYFNNNSSASLIPTIYVYPSYAGSQGLDRLSVFKRSTAADPYLLATFPGADRNTNSATIGAGTLTKITFPTGGYTAFQFEPHVFFHEHEIVGGGLRVKKITDYDGIDHAHDVVKDYSYFKQAGEGTITSGVLFNLPVYAYTENRPILSQLYGGTYPSSSTRAYFEHTMVVGSTPNYTLSGYDGVNVGYSEIVESISSNGKTVRRYSTPAPYGARHDDYDGDVGIPCDYDVNGTCDALFSVGIPNTLAVPLCGDWSNLSIDHIRQYDLAGTDLSPESFPFAPKMNYEWNRGLLLSEKNYNQSGTLVNQTINDYTVFSPKHAGPVYSYGLRHGRLQNYKPYYGGALNGDCEASFQLYYDVVSLYPIIGAVSKALSKTTTTIYDNLGNAKTDVVSYFYDYNALLPSRAERVQSDGTTLIERKKVIADFDLSQASGTATYMGYRNLYSKHILHRPIESYYERKFTNGSVVTLNASLYTYKENSGLPDIVYALKNNSLLSDFSPLSISSGTVSKDYRYEEKMFFDSYDANSNILQQHLRKDNNQAYIWGYNGSLPIATAINAKANEIYYEPFEEQGSWPGVSYDNTQVHTGDVAARIDNADPVNEIVYHSSKNLSVSLTSPTKYHYSGWIYSNGPSAEIFLFMKRVGETGYFSYVDNILTTQTNKWVYVEKDFEVPADVVLLNLRIDNNGGGTVWFDDIRLHPSAATMETVTYDRLRGVSSKSDIQSRPSYFEYDVFGRLKFVRDKDRNIVKKICYNYAGQTAPCTE